MVFLLFISNSYGTLNIVVQQLALCNNVRHNKSQKIYLNHKKCTILWYKYVANDYSGGQMLGEADIFIVSSMYEEHTFTVILR